MAAVVVGDRHHLALGHVFAPLASEGLSSPGATHPPPGLVPRGLQVLLELLREDKIHPVVAERLPLSDARRAHEMLEHSAAKGNSSSCHKPAKDTL
jgi:hypothetical protein